MKHLSLIALFASMILSNSAQAMNDKPELVDYEVRHAYVPEGYDSNDKVQFVVTGYLPNTCYRTGPVSAFVDNANSKIIVSQKVYKYDTHCLQMIVPFQKTVELVGTLPEGSFDIMSTSGTVIGKLPVKKAISTAPDDFLYAPVSDVRVETNADGSQSVTVEGIFESACMTLTELKVVEDGNHVVTALPITDSGPVPCIAGNNPFKATAKVPAQLSHGKYLLNTRVMNGDAIFKFFNVE